MHFVIADDPMHFYDFVRFFRDELGCTDVLFSRRRGQPVSTLRS
jgi:uncharacterized protein YigE (DUF2233 family)